MPFSYHGKKYFIFNYDDDLTVLLQGSIAEHLNSNIFQLGVFGPSENAKDCGIGDNRVLISFVDASPTKQELEDEIKKATGVNPQKVSVCEINFTKFTVKRHNYFRLSILLRDYN